MSRRIGLGLAAAGLAAAVTARAAVDEPVRTDAGMLGGSETSDGVQVFRGIPFAAPPVGDLRWRAPQPVEAWDGVRSASEFGDVCIQPPGEGRLNIAVLPDSPPMSEDCLYLNVWTPADAAADDLPVMLYFFGGAFTEGAGSAPLYDGTELAKKGAVVVTMNYRLGPFGFFAHPSLSEGSEHGTSGNYGLMDMIASARWVKDNIDAFGGDPDNVTVFGQSAGAMAIGALIASPAGEGLFERAIAQSLMGLGAPGAMGTLARAEQVGASDAAELGAETAEALRALDAEAVEADLQGAGVILDGRVIPEDPFLVLEAGRQNDVDVLFGSNKDESFFPGGPSAEQFRQQVRAQWGDLADEYLELYPSSTDAEAAQSSAEAFSDETFWRMRLFTRYQVEQGNSGYLYYFAQEPPAPPGEPSLGATHAAEVPYVFDNLGEEPLFPDGSDPEQAAQSAPDLEVAERVSSYWVNFAASGDPNGPGLPSWPAFRPGTDEVRAKILAADPESERLPSVERLALYDERYRRQLEQAD